ncbi:methionine adenosyltransferase domain-containing protein [Candidatus Woesearchaeota archaeon]|nr:methionine adenosyltransferase domain-containing protein [Candidatus Woesearchaeota archaeon]
MAIGPITVAAQHNSDVDLQDFRRKINDVVVGAVTGCKEQFSAEFDFPGNIAVNTKGPFIRGGWKSDEGQNDAKQHRDGFMSYGVCADSFSGEDPTKPEGPLTFLAREIANYVVRNELAGFARVYLSIDIGQKEPKTLHIFTNGTSHVPSQKIYREVREEIPLTYGKMVQRFGLYNPALYRQIVSDSDYFQNPRLPWNIGVVKK